MPRLRESPDSSDETEVNAMADYISVIVLNLISMVLYDAIISRRNR